MRNSKHCSHTLYTFRSKRRPIPGGVFIFFSPVIASEAKQSSFSSAERKLDCFASLAMTGRERVQPQLICPSGKNCPAPFAKIFRFTSDPTHFLNSHVSYHRM